MLEECVQALPKLPRISSDALNGIAAVQMLKTAGARIFGEIGSSYFNGIRIRM